MQLADRVIVITGAASGQGLAAARLFVEEGARVVLADVDRPRLGQIGSELGAAAVTVPLDVRDAAQWSELVKTGIARFGKIDGLINSAGIVFRSTIEDFVLDDFRRVLDINLMGTFLGIKTVAPAIARAGGGTIINLSSVAGLTGYTGSAAYSSSKWAVRGLTKSAAAEFGPQNIRVNCVCPGYVDTPMVNADVPDDDPLAGQRPLDVPLGRSASPRELARVFLFLTSDASSYCTGADFMADGGMTTKPPTLKTVT